MHKDRKQRDFARRLRNNATSVEQRLWQALRCEQMHGVKFRRQAAMGNYIVDFVSFAHKLIIKLDGRQHNEFATKEYNDRRTKWLNAQGFVVLRFWKHKVLENLDGAIEVIWTVVNGREPITNSPPSPALPAEGRE